MQNRTITKEDFSTHYSDDIDWSVLGPTADKLCAKGLGCQIGAGRGSDYYFFDLALVALMRGLYPESPSPF